MAIFIIFSGFIQGDSISQVHLDPLIRQQPPSETRINKHEEFPITGFSP
jgi:hypothetical protein